MFVQRLHLRSFVRWSGRSTSHVLLCRPSFSKASFPCCFHLGCGRCLPFHLNELVIQVLPYCSLDTMKNGLADCVPILADELWSPSAGTHIWSPSSHLRTVNLLCVPPICNVTSSTLSRMVASRKFSLLNLGLTTSIASEFSPSPRSSPSHDCSLR